MVRSHDRVGMAKLHEWLSGMQRVGVVRSHDRVGVAKLHECVVKWYAKSGCG